MSSRALRRIQEGSTAQGLPEAETPAAASDADKSPRKAAKGRGNLFDLLQDDQEDRSSRSEPEASPSDEEQVAAVPKKPVRKGKKKAAKARVVPVPDQTDDDLEYLSQQLETLGAASGPRPAETASKKSDSVTERLFSVKAKNLNPDNELRRVLGLDVGQASKRKPGRDHRVHLRSQYVLNQPDPQYVAPKDTGISLRLKHSDNGIQYFVFAHSGKYARAQRLFYIVNREDPEAFHFILDMCPFHVDTLMQLSDVVMNGGHAQEGLGLLEKAIHILECSFHPNFNVCSGKVRLEYKYQVNRSFFHIIFRYTLTLGGKACHGTALEFSKLLYNIDPADPLAILLLVDFYAVRSQQYEWLISLYEEWNKTRNLNLLPNFAFSVALAYFKKGNITQADELLQHGLTLFPTVLLPLLNKCSIDANMGVASHEFFLDAERKSNLNVKLLTSIYVERSYMVWKDASLLPWLERNANLVLTSVDSNDQRVTDLLEKRAKCFVGTPLNIYRHAILSNLPDTLKYLPQELISKGLTNIDPLPPADSVNAYDVDDSSSLMAEFRGFQREVRNLRERNPQDLNEID